MGAHLVAAAWACRLTRGGQGGGTGEGLVFAMSPVPQGGGCGGNDGHQEGKADQLQVRGSNKEGGKNIIY